VDKEIDPSILKDKWYGTLSRRGFSLSIIKKVLDITDIENADFILEDNI
jgi:SOS response regulatory protein OraA/RecX